MNGKGGVTVKVVTCAVLGICILVLEGSDDPSGHCALTFTARFFNSEIVKKMLVFALGPSGAALYAVGLVAAVCQLRKENRGYHPVTPGYRMSSGYRRVKGYRSQAANPCSDQFGNLLADPARPPAVGHQHRLQATAGNQNSRSGASQRATRTS